MIGAPMWNKNVSVRIYRDRTSVKWNKICSAHSLSVRTNDSLYRSPRRTSPRFTNKSANSSASLDAQTSDRTRSELVWKTALNGRQNSSASAKTGLVWKELKTCLHTNWRCPTLQTSQHVSERTSFIKLWLHCIDCSVFCYMNEFKLNRS